MIAIIYIGLKGVRRKKALKCKNRVTVSVISDDARLASHPKRILEIRDNEIVKEMDASRECRGSYG